MGRSRCRSPTVFLSILVLLFHSLIQLSNAADRITKGQSIKDGETLTSSTAETFALGFFSPGNSTNRYVGIWYNKLSVKTVVWVANRENPISNSSGVLTIESDGNLKVLDGNGKSLWSTNVSIVPGSNSTAVLMDTGNFLLCGEEIGVVDKALWQSFEDPTDTFLPGMRAGLNIKNGETKTSMYTSWKSSNDPAKGNFTMGVDPTGLAQIVIWENSKRHWRSGLWNGQIFIGVPGMRPRWLYGFQLSDLDGSKYFTYSVLSSSDILMFQIRWNGIEEQLRWDEGAKNWSRFWIQPSNICQVYNTCGAYASCSMLSSPICTCIKGFEPKSMTDWNRGKWSGGCKRRTQLQCERNSSSAAVKRDGFLELDAVKLPDHSVWKSDLGPTQCEDDCLKNCSCRAYAVVSGIGCLTWGGDLVDLQDFQQGGNKLFVRLANSELGKKKKIATWIIILCVILGIILLSTFAYLIWRKCKAKPKVLLGKGTKESTGIDMNKSREMWTDFSEQNDIGEGNNGSVPELPLLSLEVIVAATDNFSPANKLGQGGFGPVYKGRLPCGEEVAIKRLSRKSGQGAEEFKNEIILIAKLQHINLVRLLGCCIEAEEKILVYEYLPNKSLDAFIFDPKMNVQLDWQKRFNIIEGIARGILYLHRDSRLRIIHRDLKASNILLDEEMNPKISDFGMAKIFGGNQNEANTNRVVGTYGYMAPEYAMEGLFSVKSDVYSFGVLLLEILSGKKCTQYRHPESLLNLLGYFWKIWNEGKVMDFIDPCIKDSCSKGDVLRCVQVGLLCVQDLPMDRPLMSIVVLMLESETTVLPTPRQPNFTVGRTPLEMDFTIDSSEATSRNDVTVSINDVTVTMVQGR